MKKKKVTRIIQFLLTSILLFGLLSLCSCTLAKKEGIPKESDLLIGGFVTRAPLEEKIFASAEWIKPINGMRHPIEVDFEGIEGQLFYTYELYFSDVEISSIACTGDVGNSIANIRKDENGEYIEMKATLYYMPRVKEEINVFYLNPVYVTAGEQIYAVPGKSISTGGGMSSEGTKLSLSYSEEQTRTLVDERTTNRVDIHAELEAVYEPFNMYMYQMTEDHKVIKEEPFISDRNFLKVEVETDTAYVHMVTEQLLPNGKTITIRQIIDWEGDQMELYEDIDSEKMVERKVTHYESYYPVGDGFLNKDWTMFIWPEE